MTIPFDVGDIVQMRKPHPCGANTWLVTRTGADVKIRCTGCSRIVMLDRVTFERRMKKVITRKEGSAEHG
ncbi:MAG: DUF951 domain-containing protein [Christensenellales bacterium]|jgi:hypothetical protein